MWDETGARWASEDELAAAGWLDSSGWPLGESAYGPVYLPDEAQEAGTLAIAPPGAGKTRGVLIPALLSERHPTARRSLVILDPVGELYRHTAPVLKHSHTIRVWNPARRSMCNTLFDPLAGLGSPYDPTFEDRAESAAACWWTAFGGDGAGRVRGDPYWDTQPIAALTALIITFACQQPGLSMPDLARLVLPLPSDDIQAAVMACPHGGAQRRAGVLADLLKNDKAVSGVFGELRRRLLVAGTAALQETLGRPSIDVAALVAQPTALYLQVGTGDRRLLPLLSVALSSVLAEIDRLTRTRGGRPLNRPVRVVIDELQNIGELYDLAGAINTLRKFYVGVLLAVQTRAGLYNVYGQTKADAILGACYTHLLLGGLALDDADYYSRRLGQQTWQESWVDRTWRAEVMGGVPALSPHDQRHYERRHAPLYGVDELRALDRSLVAVPARLRPVEVAMNLYAG